jgi:hypothetical protein
MLIGQILLKKEMIMSEVQSSVANEVPAEVKTEENPVMTNELLVKITESGRKAANDFLSADIKHGKTKRTIVIKAAKLIGADGDKLEAFLTGYALGLVDLKYKDASIAVLKSNLKTVLVACHKIGVETIDTLPGEWNDFVSECRARVAALAPVGTPVTTKKNQGGNTTNANRKVSEKEVDSVADKAQRMSVAQNHQVIAANIAAMAEKPNFEIGLMSGIKDSLMQIAKKSQDGFWIKNAELILLDVSKILDDAKAAAEAAATATQAVKEDSKADDAVEQETDLTDAEIMAMAEGEPALM